MLVYQFVYKGCTEQFVYEACTGFSVALTQHIERNIILMAYNFQCRHSDWVMFPCTTVTPMLMRTCLLPPPPFPTPPAKPSLRPGASAILITASSSYSSLVLSLTAVGLARQKPGDKVGF